MTKLFISNFPLEIRPARGDRQKRKDRAKIIDDDVMGKNLEQWLTAKKKFHLSDAQVQMARELNLNPKKFGSLDNHGQQSWKAPLPQFIEKIYFKRFKREAQLEVIAIEKKMKYDKIKAEQQKKKRKAELKAKTG